MTKIITVHGTNASDDSDVGEQWWQRGSQFQERLAELIETDDGALEVDPFHWSGKNSEKERREAGNELRRKLIAAEREGAPYAVIGHSHGGSVLNHSLFSVYAKKLKLPNMKAWMTVGTPFIHLRRTGFGFQNFTVMGNVVLIAIISYVALALVGGIDLADFFESRGRDAFFGGRVEEGQEWEYRDRFREAMEGEAIIRTVLVSLLVAAMSGSVIWGYTARARKRGAERHIARFWGRFGRSWISLRHKSDEAITGLKAARKAEVKLIPYPTARRIATSMLIIMSALGLAFVSFLQTAPERLVRRLPETVRMETATFAEAGTIHSLAASADGRKLIVGAEDGVARIYDVTSGALDRTLRGAGAALYDVALSHDGDYALTNARTGRIFEDRDGWLAGSAVTLWDVRRQEPVTEAVQGVDWANEIGFAAASDRYFIFGYRAAMPEANGVVARAQGRFPRLTRWLMVRSATSRFANGISEDDLREAIRERRGDNAFFSMRDIAISPSGRFVAFGSSYGDVVVWDATNGAIADIKTVFDVEFEPDDDAAMRSWKRAQRNISGIAFSDDGRTIASMGQTGLAATLAFDPDAAADARLTAVAFAQADIGDTPETPSLERWRTTKVQWSGDLSRIVFSGYRRVLKPDDDGYDLEAAVWTMDLSTGVASEVLDDGQLQRLDVAGGPEFVDRSSRLVTHTVRPRRDDDEIDKVDLARFRPSLVSLDLAGRFIGEGIPIAPVRERRPVERLDKWERYARAFGDHHPGMGVQDRYGERGNSAIDFQPLSPWEYPAVAAVWLRYQFSRAAKAILPAAIADVDGLGNRYVEAKSTNDRAAAAEVRAELNEWHLKTGLVQIGSFGIYFIYAAAAGLIGAALSFIFLKPIIWMLNKSLSGQVRNLAYGNDVYGERVENVSEEAAKEFSPRWGSVPGALGAEIEEYTEGFAVETLRRVRKLLGVNLQSAELSLSDAVSQQLSWKELIHTAYFDVDNFVKLTAVALIDAGLARPSEEFARDRDYDRVCEWYADMKPEPAFEAEPSGSFAARFAALFGGMRRRGEDEDAARADDRIDALKDALA
ncbi:MAG: hypothetical protein GC152_03170 [Alphaproteobacteria bacterium]|nr:hypothetical protein [Alphaproteobacteria bacterium]